MFHYIAHLWCICETTCKSAARTRPMTATTRTIRTSVARRVLGQQGEGGWGRAESDAHTEAARLPSRKTKQAVVLVA